MKKYLSIVTILILLTACSTKTTSDKKVAPSDSAESSEVTLPIAMSGPARFKMNDQNDSKQSGSATLEEVDGSVKVTISLENGVSEEQPAHIHIGACPTPGEVKYPLNSVINGKSETTLPSGVTIASLGDLGPLAVNVHKSMSDLKTYVSCADLDWSQAAK